MSFNVVTVKFSNEKTCFVSLSAGIFRADSKQAIQVFEIEDSGGGRKAFVSWSGETTRAGNGNDGSLQINGLYGDKLGLKDKDTVVLRPVPVVSTCIRVSVEPLSVDDWEILDRHTSFIESNLMDQVRVIQRDRVYPIWVTKSTVIYIKIGATTPDTDCVLLVNETEVLVSPKVRSAMIGQPVIEEPMQKSVTNHLNAPFLPNSSSLDEVDTFDTKFSSTDSDYSLKDFRDNDRKIREKSPYDMSNISNHWRGLFEYLGFRRRMENTINVSDDENDDNDEDDSMDQSDNTLPSGLNLILRVQHLKHTIKESDQTPTEPVRRGSHSPRKNGNRSPRKRSSESPSKTHKSPSNPSSSFSFNQFPQQPSTIYMDKSEVEKQLKCNRNNIPSVFLAKLRRLPTPREQQQEKLSQSYHSGSSGKSSPRKGSKNDRNVKDKPSPDLSDSMKSDGSFTMEGDSSCVVRVVTLDRRRQLCNDRYRDIVLRIQEEQPLLNGHVIIPDMLRRFLKLETTSRVWIQTYKGAPTRTHAFSLYPLGNVPNHVTNDMMTLAVRQWLDQVSNEDYPLVVFQGLFVRFPVLPDKYVESQITYNEQDSYSKCCHTLLHPGVLRNASMSVVSGGRSTERTHPAVQPMLAYNSILNYSPVVPDTQLNMIGGMSDIIEAALSNIEICLGSRSLYKEVFMTTPGLLNGMLLLTGPKGSGKTTLARALCREVSELPNLAHTMIVECKPLRGKKSDSIQKIFEMLFDEAAWHQPSLVVLEDLDHLAGSPAGPEFEMTGEALYAARIAEIVKDLLRKDIRNMSNIAVLATSQSRSSLHSILVSSRGTHLVQDVMCIKPPDQKQRQEILRTLLEVMTTVSQSSLNSLDWEQLAQSTQGYVARDLENIVNRAVHAHILRQGRAIQNDGELDLNQDDFLIAMEGFTPASIRNVPLHQAGELGWDDIGGLTDVKETLVETLQWPTKYPALFANCPLRIRSGLLLYGAPGTGKTLLAGVVAKECGLNFISIKGPELLSKYIGASEQAVRDTFVRLYMAYPVFLEDNRMNLSRTTVLLQVTGKLSHIKAQSAKPCILFFDEFDSIAPRRGHDNTGVTDRVVNQLLTQLDGVEGLDGVYVLAATSRPDLIDPALLRPGRLDKSLLCKLPNEEERLKILKALSRKMSLERDIEFEHFAKTCQDFTGADFKAMLYNAQLEAIHEFTSQDAAAESDMGRFGMKSRKNNFAAKMKNRANTKLKINVKNERRKSFSSGTFAFIPNLEEGVVQVSAEMEERLNTQVSQIRLRDRRNSEHFTGYDEPDSPFFNNKLIVVSQAHMLSAFSKMRPSVSGQERLKYQRIYENFVSSRGGNFDTGILEALSMKATLA